MSDLENVIDAVMKRPATDSNRLEALADYVKHRLDLYGLGGAQGGSGRELKVHGLARDKDWDVAKDYAGKFRLLISLKSMWSNASGTVPNRLDDLMGEVANVQQLSPELVIGYVVVFDSVADSIRKADGLLWSEFFESRIKAIAIRKAPLWNQGLVEGSWFIRIDSKKDKGDRVTDPAKVEAEERAFFRNLLDELRRREPAIPFHEPDPSVI